MKTVAFHNLGCKVNSYEMEVMQQKFKESEYEIVPFDSIADVYVINTCSVTNIADRKSRQMLHRAKKTNPEAVVIAAGCYAQTDTEGADADDAVDIIVGNNRKTEIVSLLEEYLSRRENADVSGASIDTATNAKLNAVSDLSKGVPYEDCGIYDSAERIRVDIKIQDGCDQFCSYCIIPYARGRVRSRDMQSVTEEVARLADKGFKEIVLTGIHLSSYGVDLMTDASGKRLNYNTIASGEDFTNEELLRVIEAVSKTEGIKRVRLGSLEPRVITEDFLKALTAIDSVCPHFHLSLQSGCDATLKRMNRRYTTDEYYEKVAMLREFYDDPAITTDIITGFPGENEEEFEQTVRFVEKVKFYETHVFKYSKRKGTVAASLPGQNTEAVKAARSDVLLEICDKNREDFLKARMDREVEMLIEEERVIDGRRMYVGHTKEYIQAAVDAEKTDGNRGAELCQPSTGEILSGKCESVRDGRIVMLEYPVIMR